MLGAMASILTSALEGGLILIVIMLALKSKGLPAYKFPFYLGIGAALASALTIVYGFDYFGDREIFEGYLAFTASIAAVSFWLWARFHIGRSRFDYPAAAKNNILLNCLFVFLVTGVTVLGKLNEIVLFPTTFLNMSTSLLNTELLAKIAGMILSLLLTGIFVFVTLKNVQRVSARLYLNFSAAVLLVLVLRQLITVLQVLFATGVLPLTNWAVNIIAPLINDYYPAFFYVLTILTFILWGMVSKKLAQNPPDTDSAVNPARKRKVLAAFNREKRWSRAMGIMLLTMMMILGGNAALANRGVKMAPPTPVMAEGEEIYLPLAQVNDGRLHRFSYLNDQHIEIRFIVIKKGEGLYGTGLDACDICGSAGYYQRGKEVVCKNCDVVINIPTIGFPGGCNPIPLKTRISGQKLVIATGDLNAKQDVFQE